jgi:hypothetical protein
LKYLLLLYGDPSAEAALSTDERRAIVDEHIRFHSGLRERGALVQGEPLADRSGAFTVRRDPDAQNLVTDGPFIETKEQIGSFYLIECADRTEALAIASEVPSSPGLVVEALPVAQM